MKPISLGSVVESMESVAPTRFGDFETKPLAVVLGEQGAKRMRQDDVTLVTIVAGAIDERG